jgi:hypothetical protein
VIVDQDQALRGKTWNVTRRLFLGHPPAGVPAVSVATAIEAVRVIGSGQQAVLPTHRWDLASEVLRQLGVRDDERLDRLMLARYGRSIPVERLAADELAAALKSVGTRSGESPRQTVLCVECGYVEAVSSAAISANLDRYRPAACPVCHGRGFD